jgi:23S rRNA pseudouridine1911/1915/1917 synthase
MDPHNKGDNSSPQGDSESDNQGFRQIIITKEHLTLYKRFDHLLSSTLSEYSRSFLTNLFKKKLISLDESSPYQGKLELKRLPPVGSIITVEIPPPAPSDAIAQDIPLDILFEDEHLLVINKPIGMVVHPAPGHPDGTLVNAVLFHCRDLTGVGDQLRPGIVHRLDKGTSGVIVVAKNQKAHEGLVLLFSSHDIEREYQAIVMKTKMAAINTVEATIGRHKVHRQKMATHTRNGRWAKTYIKTHENFSCCTHVLCTLETGRTHQIRVHLASELKAPILMDPLYGSPVDHLKRIPNELKPILKDYPHPLLHAKKLGFIHPITKKKLLFEAEPPKVFSEVLDFFRKLEELN